MPSITSGSIVAPTRQPSRRGSSVFKLVVLGEGGVGKSALTLQFVSHSFSENHDPTIEDAYTQQAVIDGEPALLDILDTAGQIEFTAMREQYMRCGEGFLLCFSLIDHRSFEEVLGYKKQIMKVRGDDSVPMVLVGNKLDLSDKRKVSTEEGQTLAFSMGCPYYETSAALRQNVDDCFHSLVREIRKKQKMEADTGKYNGSSLSRHPRSMWNRLRNVFLWVFRRNRAKN